MLERSGQAIPAASYTDYDYGHVICALHLYDNCWVDEGHEYTQDAIQYRSADWMHWSSTQFDNTEMTHYQNMANKYTVYKYRMYSGRTTGSPNVDITYDYARNVCEQECQSWGGGCCESYSVDSWRGYQEYDWEEMHARAFWCPGWGKTAANSDGSVGGV